MPRLIGIDPVEKCPLKRPWEQVIQLAHRNTLAELVEIQHPVAVRII